MEKIYLNTYLVVYDGDIEHIKKQFDSYMEITKNVYLIRSEKSSGYVSSKLVFEIDYNDRLIVVKLGNQGTWVDSKDGFSEWIENALGDHWHIYNYTNEEENNYWIYIITYYTNANSYEFVRFIKENYINLYLFQNTWLIKTDKKSGIVGKELRKIISPNDKFAIIELGNDHSIKLDEF